MLPKVTPFPTFVCHKSWCSKQEQSICEWKLILMFSRITKIVLVFKIYEAKASAKICWKIGIIYLSFLKQYFFISFYPISENVETKIFLYGTRKLEQLSFGTPSVTFLSRSTWYHLKWRSRTFLMHPWSLKCLFFWQILCVQRLTLPEVAGVFRQKRQSDALRTNVNMGASTKVFAE